MSEYEQSTTKKEKTTNQVAIDSYSNKASPATVNSDGNAFQASSLTFVIFFKSSFQVYIGNPGEFPFLRNRAVQIQPGHENHVEVGGHHPHLLSLSLMGENGS